jgi:hypothetical protein
MPVADYRQLDYDAALSSPPVLRPQVPNSKVTRVWAALTAAGMRSVI